MSVTQKSPVAPDNPPLGNGGKHTCYACYRVIEVPASITNDKKPHPGAFTVCFYCGHISVLDADLNLKPATQQELDQLQRRSFLSYMLLKNVSDFIISKNFKAHETTK
ncbi:MAG: hypothetical protein ABI921_00520 [Panacibacter sp.]